VHKYQDELDETVNKLKFGDEDAVAVPKPSARNKIAMLSMLDINQAVSKSFFQQKKRRSIETPLEPQESVYRILNPSSVAPNFNMDNYDPDIVRDSMDDYLKKLNNHIGINKTIVSYQTKAGRASNHASKRAKKDDDNDEVLFFKHRDPNDLKAAAKFSKARPSSKEVKAEIFVQSQVLKTNESINKSKAHEKQFNAQKPSLCEISARISKNMLNKKVRNIIRH
jgi:hypothetical protein